MKLRQLPKTANPLSCSYPGCEAHSETENSARDIWHYDVEKEDAIYCSNHTMLEDLDPEDPRNDRLLSYVPIARNLAFPDAKSMDDLLGKPSKGSKVGVAIWVRDARTDPGSPRLLDVYATPTDALHRWLGTRIYGNEGEISHHYYLEVLSRGDGTVVIYQKFQRIIGNHMVARIPEAAYDEWLRTVRSEGENHA